MAENIVMRQQLIVVARKHKKSPPLAFLDRLVFGLASIFTPFNRLSKVAITRQPATILKFHRALVKKKYQILYGKSQKKRGSKGFGKEVVNVVLEIKKRNPSYACPRIALLVNEKFGVKISEQTVRRILRKNYKPKPGDGPSWQTFFSSQKDNLWCLDFFRSESISLGSYWGMLVIDQYTRRIIGFSVSKESYDGVAACCMFNKILGLSITMPKYLVTDNDPVFQYECWGANLRVAWIKEVKSIPDIPISNPFVERAIGTTRQEFMDHTLFWNKKDLEGKLLQFQKYYNEARVHYSLKGARPDTFEEKKKSYVVDFKNYKWKTYCNGMYQSPIAA